MFIKHTAMDQSLLPTPTTFLVIGSISVSLSGLVLRCGVIDLYGLILDWVT